MTHLYRHYDASGALLYVGIAADAAKRLRQHSGALWRKAVTRTEIETFPNRELAAKAELSAQVPIHQRIENGLMTQKQFRAALDQLGLTQGQAAEWLGISIRTVNGWANGRPVPEYVAKLLRLVIRLGIDPKDV